MGDSSGRSPRKRVVIAKINAGNTHLDDPTVYRRYRLEHIMFPQQVLYSSILDAGLPRMVTLQPSG